MAAEDDLRLAWQAHREGRPGLRDSLLTLAAATAGVGDGDWPDRCFDRLVATRPDHPFATFANRKQAVADPLIVARLAGLRSLYPPTKVDRMLIGGAAARGPFTGRREGLKPILDDLLAAPIRPGPRRPPKPGPPLGPLGMSRPDPSAGPSPRPRRRSRAPRPVSAHAPRLAAPPDAAGPEELGRFYLTVLLGLAVLLEMVLRARPADAA